MTTCATCSAAVTRHTDPVHCSQTHRCRRCEGQPSCYMCQSSFCFCASH